MKISQIIVGIAVIVLGAFLFVRAQKAEEPTTKVYVDSVATEVPVEQVEQPNPALGGSNTVTLEKVVIDPTKSYTFTNAVCNLNVGTDGKITAIYYCPKGALPDGKTGYRQSRNPTVIINGVLQ